MNKKTGSNRPGRPRTFSKEVALDAAMAVFASKGYESASLTDLTAAMGVNRVSMYATFGNKEALFVKAFTRYVEVNQKRLTACAAAATAREGLDKLLRDSVERFTDPREFGVCFITQGPLSDAAASKETKLFAATQRAGIESFLRSLLERAIEQGELASSVSTADLARFYAVILQGIALQAQHGSTAVDLLHVVDFAMAKWPFPVTPTS